MRKILFSAVALLSLAFLSCNKSELEPTQESTYTIKASIENFGTKTTMDGNTVIWEEGDQIALFTNDVNEDPILFTLVYGAGTPNGDFSTNVNIDGKIFVAALYPYDANARYSSDKITTNLASSYTWKEGANGKAPMATLLPNIVLATGSNSLGVTFKNAGALIALTVNNIPAGYNSISLSSGIKINGATKISFTDGVPSSTVTATEEANKTTTINFASSATTTDKVFYFPLGVTEGSTAITIKMTDGSSEPATLYDAKTMEKAVRNTRYYASISFDGMGNLPTSVNGSDINTKIGEGTTNFILDENADNVNITEETTKDLQIAVTSDDESFALSGEGPKGTIGLSTPVETENLNLDVPNATVELKPNEGFATYETVTAKTAANTLIIPASVTINTLIVNGGNVRVYGKIVNIQRGEFNEDEKTIIYKEAGANIPNDLSEEFTVIDNSTDSSSPFAGGNGTENNPYLIGNADQLSKISDYYDTYNYFKIADGVETLDLTGKGRLKLNGSFDGNEVTINNLATSLFEYVGNINKKQDIKISNLTANVRTTDGRALVRNIFNPGETTFENVTLHGYIEGQYNMGSFYNYGTANAAGSEGANYTVNFKNAKSDATLVCTTGNAIGGMLGHGYEGADYTLSINMDADYTGVMYTTGTAKCYKVMAMCSHSTYILNGQETSRYTNEYTSTKLTVTAPTKGEVGYYVTPANGVNHYIVYLNCQLTAYDENNNKLSNWAGLTWNLGNTTINSGFDSKIFELFESAEIVNGNEHEIGYNIEDAVLKVYTGSSMNFKSGWITLQVNQYDSENNLLSTGITTVHTFPDPAN